MQEGNGNARNNEGKEQENGGGAPFSFSPSFLPWVWNGSGDLWMAMLRLLILFLSRACFLFLYPACFGCVLVRDVGRFVAQVFVPRVLPYPIPGGL